MDDKGNEFAIMDTMTNMAVRLAQHERIVVSVSGGSDSDLILHMICTYFREHLPKIHFVFSNTGLEYKATLRHLDELERKYDVKIDRIRGIPVPVVVRKYGTPTLSKQLSETLTRLQKHGFEWEDDDFEVLNSKYENSKAALRWWCNAWGEGSRFNIEQKRYLKEYLMNNPPDFTVSNECCRLSKKEPMKRYEKEMKADLIITGERKFEGGARASAHKGCFERKNNIDHYMPLWWWENDTKQKYKEMEGIRYSDCYEVYGLKRTGCVGCPYARKWKEELMIMKQFEPNLYTACINVFGKGYKLKYDYEQYKEEHSKNDKIR